MEKACNNERFQASVCRWGQFRSCDFATSSFSRASGSGTRYSPEGDLRLDADDGDSIQQVLAVWGLIQAGGEVLPGLV